jgi:16S rRNA (adenine1518-N6/adenine1519-N6)-dimethyltransferase
MRPRSTTKLLGELVRVAFSQRRKLLRQHRSAAGSMPRATLGAFDVQRARRERCRVAEYLALAAAC